MSLHNSPHLLSHKVLGTSPCRDWLALTENADDFFRLATTLSGIPTTWLRWTEKIVAGRQRKNRHRVADPLGYRMSVLWNGIIFQQETKFLCDVMENALRLGILKHSHRRNVLLEHVDRTFPKKPWERLLEMIEKDQSVRISPSEPLQEILLINLTFYQTCEIVSRNWNRIKHSDAFIVGFGDLFWKNKACRDGKLFEREMKVVREARNKIAHSKALFEIHETQRVYDIVRKWSSPIDATGIDNRIARFRRNRPSFLEGIF
jgi:hypothetical protein